MHSEPLLYIPVSTSVFEMVVIQKTLTLSLSEGAAAWRFEIDPVLRKALVNLEARVIQSESRMMIKKV